MDKDALYHVNAMKIRVWDSDGLYQAGLFKTGSFNDRTCRAWRAPPHPDYNESLIDIADKANPCHKGSWFRLQISTHPRITGPADGSDDFDEASRAYRITPQEAREWLTRNGFTPPPDLLALVGPVAGVSMDAVATFDPHAPYMPAVWFKEQFGILSERLRSAQRKKRIVAVKRQGKLHYSVPQAQALWPSDNIHMPS